MSSEPLNFVLHAGRNRRVRLTFVDENGARIDLTGGIVHWAAEPSGSALGAADIIVLDSAAGTIEILDQTDPDTKGQADLIFVPADTAALDDQVLDHESYAIDVAGDTHPGPEGTVTIDRDIA